MLYVLLKFHQMVLKDIIFFKIEKRPRKGLKAKSFYF